MNSGGVWIGGQSSRWCLTARPIKKNFGQGSAIGTDASFGGYALIHGADWQAGFFNDTSLPQGLDSCNPEHEHCMG